MGKWCLIGLFCFSFFNLFGQDTASIIGGVLDQESKETLPGAIVLLVHQNNEAIKYFVTTNESGGFKIEGIQKGSYKVQISFLGYHDFEFTLQIDQNIELGPVQILPNTIVLGGVEIKGMAPTVMLKGDTTMVLAKSYKTHPDATAEDLLEKMPSVVLNNGKIEAQGEEVKKVLVDGKPFFGDDPNAALKNLPAEVVERVEIFDQLSEQSAFTGFNDGNTTKTINIVTKKEFRNGTFGRVFAGYGTDSRYSAGGNINKFSGAERFSVIGLGNNVNLQNFSSEDLLGVVSSTSNRRGRGRGRGGPGRSGNNNNFLVGDQNGLTTTSSIGSNYTNQIGKKLELTASYLYNNTDNENDEVLNRRYLLSADSGQYYQELSSANAINYNNRIDVRMDYKLNDNNSILLVPAIKFQKNVNNENFYAQNFTNESEILNKSVNSSENKITGYNVSNMLLWRHRFSKRGRTFSANIRSTFTDSNGESFMMAFNELNASIIEDTVNQKTISKQNGVNWNGRLAYSEPVGKNSQLMLQYSFNKNNNNADQGVFGFDETDSDYSNYTPELSNVFKSDYTTQGGGISFRSRKRGKMFSAGMHYEHATLKNKQIDPMQGELEKSFSNFLPMVVYRNRLSKSKNIFLMYRATTNQPSISQLQNVIDNSNSLLLTAGNPDLKQEYAHVLTGRFSLTKTTKQQNTFLLVYAKNTQNYISNASYIARKDTVLSDGIVLNKGAQFTQPVNVNNHWNVKLYGTHGVPISGIQSNLNISAGVTYTRTPGVVNQMQSTTQNTAFSMGAVVGSNISQYVDFTFSHNGAYNVVHNDLEQNSEDNYYSQNTKFKLNVILAKSLVFRTNASYQSYHGLSEAFNQNFWLWNASFGKKFMKNQQGELMLKAYDLLNQNQSITRSVTESYLEDASNVALQQYFMLSFTYTIKNFKKG